MDILNYVWPGLAVGLAGIWVAIGQWMLAKRAVEVMGKNPAMSTFYLTVTILGMALVESAVIYGLVLSFSIFGSDSVGLYTSIGAGLAVWLTGFWVGIGEWYLISAAFGAIEKSPDTKGKIMTFMVLFVALVESAAIYGLIVWFKLIGADGADNPAAIGIGLSVGLAGLWVGIWEGIVAKRALDVIGERPSMISFYLTVTILGIALVESAVIYGLVVSFQMFDAAGIGMYSAIGAGLAIGLAGLGAWVGEGQLVAWALTAMNRNPDIKGKILVFMILFLALIEVTAIYGLIIAFQIINSGVENMNFMGAWFAIWLAGLWVAIGRWYLSETSLEVMGKNPKMISFLLTVSILWVALVESAAIYGLIVAFQIMDSTTLTGLGALGAGLAIGLTGLGAWVGEGLLIKGAINGINAAPESKGKIMAFMVLFVALVEVIAIYGLIVAFKILG